LLIKIKNILKNNLKIKDKYLLTTFIIETWILGIMIYLHIFDSPRFLWLIPIFCILFLILFGVLYEKIEGISIEIIGENHKNVFAVFIISFVIILIGQVIYWMSYYPGGFNLDALGQWDQVHGKQQLNNWHPVLTTLFYWILSQFNDSLAFCIFVQLVVFAFSLSYFFMELYKNGINKWFIIISSIVVAINPAIGMNNVCLIKDVPFSIVIIWIWLMIYKIYLSKGNWITRIENMFLLVLAFTALSLIRHNAIFLSVPVVIIGIITYRKYYKYFISVSMISVLLLMIIEGALFSTFKVEQHSNMVGEMVGVPMAIMANAYINDYENTPNDVKDFLEEIAPYSEWQRLYFVGEWDSCKWELGGIELLKDDSLLDVIGLTYKTVISCPQAAYESIRENMRMVWQIIGPSYWSPWVYIEENEYGIEEGNVKPFYNIEQLIEESENNILASAIFWNIGFEIVIFLLINWIAFIKRKYNSIIFITPIITYDLLTMCLLSGPSFRYFYFNSVLFFPVIGIILGMCSCNKVENEIRKNSCI